MSKLAIIADIHDNLVNLNHFLDWVKTQSIDTLICAGDVTNSKTLNILANNFTGTIHLVKGNAEIYTEEEIAGYPNIEYHKKLAIFTYNSYNLGVCHEPFLIKKLQEYKNLDYIFYAHTHKPWIYKENKTIIANPGTLGGMFSRASFSILNNKTGNLELKLLEYVKSQNKTNS